MLSHRLSLIDVMCPVLAQLVLIEQCMSSLVDRTVHTGQEEIFEKMRRNTLIIRSHTVCERVLCRRECAALKIKTDYLEQIARHLLLQPFIYLTGNEIVPDYLPACHDSAKEGNQAGTAFVKHLVKFRGSHSPLIKVQKIVIDNRTFLCHQIYTLQLYIPYSPE